MQEPPPLLNLLVIRSRDIHHAVKFYEKLGMKFHLDSHGQSPEHYVSDNSGIVFEIYPLRNMHETATQSRFGFRVQDVDAVVEKLREVKATLLTPPQDTEWGRRAVVQDFDGHTIELVKPPA